MEYSTEYSTEYSMEYENQKNGIFLKMSKTAKMLLFLEYGIFLEYSRKMAKQQKYRFFLEYRIFLEYSRKMAKQQKCHFFGNIEYFEKSYIRPQNAIFNIIT